ncbi:MAG: hypothetical protein WKG07_24570 [Hymenobacter sp.]
MNTQPLADASADNHDTRPADQQAGAAQAQPNPNAPPPPPPRPDTASLAVWLPGPCCRCHHLLRPRRQRGPGQQRRQQRQPRRV